MLRAQLNGLSLRRRRRFLRKGRFPMFLFKYMNPNRLNGLDFIENIVVRNRLYLSSPADFNDPFDTRLSMDLQGSPTERRDGLRLLARRVLPKTTRQQRDIWVKGAMIQSADRNPFEGKLSVLPAGIHSFSSTGRSILAWGHYADSHRGICIILEPAQSLSPLIHTIPVTYQEEFTTLNYATANDEAVEVAYQRSITTKSLDWKYEREHRLIFMDKAGHHLPFSPQALFGIIFGINATDETIAAIRQMDEVRIATGLPPLKMFKAHSSSNKYAIHFFRLGAPGRNLSRPIHRKG